MKTKHPRFSRDVALRTYYSIHTELNDKSISRHRRVELRFLNELVFQYCEALTKQQEVK